MNFRGPALSRLLFITSASLRRFRLSTLVSGSGGFKDKLLGLLEKADGKLCKKGSLAGDAIRAHHESEAERIIGALGKKLGLPESRDGLLPLKKNDSRKVACAALVKARNAMTNDWIAQRLAMGHPASMCQLVHHMRKDPKDAKQLKRYEKTLKPKDWCHFDDG